MKCSLPFLLALAVAAAGCGGNSSTTSTVTAPAASGTAETFTGTVPVQGSDFHNFTVAQTGAVSLNLTAASPPPTIFMGLALGTPSASACAVLPGDASMVQASATAQLSGTVAAGTYCVLVYDVGNQQSPVAYSVTVVHP